MAEKRRTDEADVWFVSVRPEGRPHVVPILVRVRRGRVLGRDRREERQGSNLRTNPAVSVHLESGAAPVVAEGHARVVARPYPAAVVAEFHSKYAWDVAVEVCGPGS